MSKKDIAIKYLSNFYLKDFMLMVMGVLIYVLGLHAFIIPTELVTGGLTGVALIIRYATGVELSTTTFVANAILFAIAVYPLGFRFIVKSLIGVVTLLLALKLGEMYFAPYFSTHRLITDELLSVAMGGITAGCGLGLVYSVGYSTGGVDIIGFLVTKYFRMSIARALLIVDVLVIISSYFILNSLPEKTVLSLILLPVFYQMVEMVMNGSRQSVQLFIMSDKYEEIATHINAEIMRGCTVVDGLGWYTKKPQKIIIVLARKTEANSIFRLVRTIDPDAFVSLANVMGVYGKGFDKLN